MTKYDTTWYLDTGWGTGAITVDDRGIIVKTAPIFRSLLQLEFDLVKQSHQNWNWEPLESRDV